MEILLSELELDLREINYLIKLLPDDPLLNPIVVRRIKQMQLHLDNLLHKVEAKPNKEEAIPALPEEAEPTILLADSLKPATDIKSFFTLNDKFLFSRELFDGNMERMNNILQQISEMESYDNATLLLTSVLNVEEDNEVLNDFLEVIKKHFA